VINQKNKHGGLEVMSNLELAKQP